MSPATSSLPSSDPRLKWKKRKRDAGGKRPKPVDDEEEEELEEEEMVAKAARNEAEDSDRHQNDPLLSAADPVLDLRESEVINDDGQKISDFPFARRRTINRPHSSVLALVAAERWNNSASSSSTARRWAPPFLENISHGQLQALSAVLPDHPSLLQLADLDKPSAYVCTPPPLMEWKGIEKKLSQDQVFIVPMHADWFSASSVHRLERQVVPHFFTGKSPEHTPERYIMLRNKIIFMYIENPARRLSLADCQELVPQNELYDISRVVRFLDNWGIINYLAALSVHRGLRMAGALLREDVGGELDLKTSPLKSIDSLILFDRPKSSCRPEDVTLLSSSSSSLAAEPDSVVRDLDSRIRERLAENTCNYCSRPLPGLHYQSEKEADIMLCSDCFHDAKFVTGHSSIDFIKVDSKNENPDPDGDCWTDEETLRLLEAIEKYRDKCDEKKFNDSWNAIAEYVGTKSKAQCILHFVQLPMEDSLLENIDIPHMAVSSDYLNSHDSGSQQSNSNDDSPGVGRNSLDPGDHLPFADSPNPVMSLVAFLASAIGPRVAAACANTALCVLTKGNFSTSSGVSVSGSHLNLGHQKDATEENQAALAKREASSPLSPELVKYAAACGLSTAAMKAKLFADQEEREIQRLCATIVNHQLKRLELKLKQFAEVETLLLKECEHAERMRQRFSTEKVKLMSARIGTAGSTLQASAGATMSVNNPASRQPAPNVQGNMSPAYANNNMAHNQMPFMPRPQMFSYGPRLPLSAIHPSQSGPSQNAMFNSNNMASTSNHHPLLRSSSGNNSSAS